MARKSRKTGSRTTKDVGGYAAAATAGVNAPPAHAAAAARVAADSSELSSISGVEALHGPRSEGKRQNRCTKPSPPRAPDSEGEAASPPVVLPGARDLALRSLSTASATLEDLCTDFPPIQTMLLACHNARQFTSKQEMNKRLGAAYTRAIQEATKRVLDASAASLLPVLLAARETGETAVVSKCRDLIAERCSELLRDGGFLDMDPEEFSLLLETPQCDAMPLEPVIRAVVRYVDNQLEAGEAVETVRDYGRFLKRVAGLGIQPSELPMLQTLLFTNAGDPASVKALFGLLHVVCGGGQPPADYVFAARERERGSQHGSGARFDTGLDPSDSGSDNAGDSDTSDLLRWSAMASSRVRPSEKAPVRRAPWRHDERSHGDGSSR